MAERAAITQGVQIGVESTSGTAVAANRRLRSIGIEPNPQANIDTFRPPGQKYAALTALGKEWMEFGLSGRPSYNELQYVLASILGNTVISTPVGATDARKWAFGSNTFSEDAVETMTVEQGGSVRAHRFAYGLVTEASLAISRDAVELGGSGIGRRIEDDITLTAAPTSFPLVPILGNQMDVYADGDFADIGDTKLGRLLSCNWSLSSRFNPLWIIDSSQPSFITHVENEPGLSFEMIVEADEEGMAYLTQLRASGRSFIKIKATGPIIEAAIPYSLNLNMAGEIGAMGGFSDQDGVYAVGWTFSGVDDSDMGNAVNAELINKVAAF
jgi:hypothetical protein